MRIMTFNVQHCMDFTSHEIDFGVMAKVINDFDPDILGLNEIRNKGENEDYQDQLTALASLTGLSNQYFAEALKVRGNNPYGDALLTKYHIVSVETIGIPDPEVKIYETWYETRCLLKAKLENGITVLISHFGLNPDEQENAVKVVMEHLVDEKCILMGDFNVSPEDPVLNPIRARMKDTADVFTQPLLSYPSDKPEAKIDYIFVSPDIEVVSADIPEILASDHRPHMATVNIPE